MNALPTPTIKVTAKNQVTLPAYSSFVRSLDGVTELRGVQFHEIRSDTKERFPVFRLLTQAQLDERVAALKADENLTRKQRSEMVTKINGRACYLSVDKQRRIVMPAPVVQFLQLTGEVRIFDSDSLLQVWNPEHWQRYDSYDDEDLLSSYL